MTYADLMNELEAKAKEDPERRICPWDILHVIDPKFVVVLDDYLGALSLWGDPVVATDATMLLVLLHIPY